MPKRVMARMVGNYVLDIAVGAIPLLGDLGDVYFKANKKNLALLQKALERMRTAEVVR